MTIHFGATLYAWKSEQIILHFMLAEVLAITFGFQQVWFSGVAHQMFPIEFLKNKEAVLFFILMAVCNETASFHLLYSSVLSTHPRQFTSLFSCHASAAYCDGQLYHHG